MNAPCLGCERRELGCHGKCNDYKQFKVDLEEAKKKQSKYVQDRIYHVDSVRSVKRRYGVGGRRVK